MTTQQKLDMLTAREKDLRISLTLQLQSLSDQAARAARKIETRAYEDGITGFDHYWDAMKDAEEQLTNIIDDIKFAQWELEDERNDAAAEIA